MPFRVRAEVVVTLGFVLSMTACHHTNGGPAELVAAHPQKCNVNQIMPRDIAVTAAATTANIGHGNSITFSAGAITGTGTYHVDKLFKNGEEMAGVKITAVGSSPTQFEEPVILHLNYAGCPFQNDSHPFFIVTYDQFGKPVSIGGAKSGTGKYVEALLGHLSDYAIAM